MNELRVRKNNGRKKNIKKLINNNKHDSLDRMYRG